MARRFYNNSINKKRYIRECVKNRYKGKEYIPDAIYLKYSFAAPSIFSLIENPKETVLYFNKIIEVALYARDFVKIRFDLSKVTRMTIDVVMYMIAIAANVERDKYQTRYNILVPKDTEISNVILSSGIDQFFDTREMPINENSDIFRIKMGNKTDVGIASKICDFTNENLDIDKKHTGFLYDMLIEMMTNTGQHAYTRKERIRNQWFIFAENSPSSIRYTFIDTGVGIPKTMSQYVLQLSESDFEKDGFIKELLDKFSKDEKCDALLLLTGLRQGGFRTRTEKAYRGKGLPEIYDYFRKEKKTSNLKIISGGCLCGFDEQNREKAIITELDDKFVGTLFYWEIDKQNLEKEVV